MPESQPPPPSFSPSATFNSYGFLEHFCLCVPSLLQTENSPHISSRRPISSCCPMSASGVMITRPDLPFPHAVFSSRSPWASLVIPRLSPHCCHSARLLLRLLQRPLNWSFNFWFIFLHSFLHSTSNQSSQTRLSLLFAPIPKVPVPLFLQDPPSGF